MPNRRPTHPGEALGEIVFPAINVSRQRFAQTLGISRCTSPVSCLELRSKWAPDENSGHPRNLPSGWLEIHQNVAAFTFATGQHFYMSNKIFTSHK